MKKQGITNHMGKFTNIPQKIHDEILSRLPVKTLMQCKSVCKSWHTLISNPQFSRLHLKQALHHNLYLLSDLCCPLEYDPPDVKSKKNVFKFLAYCNGLFCVSSDEDEFVLWNPSTRKARKIPNSKTEFPAGYDKSATVIVFGLGYHSAADDYKLVRISMFKGEDNFQTEVKIYSRNSNTWKRIGDFPYHYPSELPGVYVNGRLHWSLYNTRDGEFGVDRVGVLDIAEEETYEMIQLPPGGRKSVHFDIGNLGENLIMFHSSVETGAEIWILKEYGNTESWTRIKIPTNIDKNLIWFEALCLLNSNEILLRVDAKEFVRYNNIKEKVGFNILKTDMLAFKVVSYVESLESP